jgi:hypothetical protein
MLMLAVARLLTLVPSDASTVTTRVVASGLADVLS